MVFGGNDNYPDDYFNQSRMTFGDHLEELRLHLWRAIVGFGIAMILCFFIGKPVLQKLIIDPVESQLGVFYDRRAALVLADKRKQGPQITANLPDDAGKPQLMHVEMVRSEVRDIIEGRAVTPAEDPKSLGDEDWVQFTMRVKPLEVAELSAPVLQALGPKPSMKTMNVTEAFMVYFKVSMACGLVVASPWIFWQIWMFVAAGLYPHEKRYVHLYLPFSLTLFLAGALLCQFVVLPKAIEALLWFNEWLNLDPDLRLNEWLGFAISMPIVFGVAFQTPLVMLFLYKLGIVDIDAYKAKRKIAFFVLAVVAALITPSIDAVSMLFLWFPLCALYELGIWLCVWTPRHELAMDDGPDEQIEV